MRLERLPSPYSGTVHRSPSLDLRISRRRTAVRPPSRPARSRSEPNLPLLPSELFPEEEAEDRKVGRWALCIALMFHAVMLFTVFPQLNLLPEPERPERVRRVYVVQPMRYRMPPPPPAGGKPQVRQQKQLIPVPDLTPDQPEPVWVELPEIDLPDIEFPIEIPPGPGGVAAPNASTGGDGWEVAAQSYGAQRIANGIEPPIKIYAPQPSYTEAARQEKLEGFVIVEMIIDTAGGVAEAKIRKGLPLGLSETAIETVRGWKFQPATRGGKPVAVFFVVSIAFHLQ